METHLKSEPIIIDPSLSIDGDLLCSNNKTIPLQQVIAIKYGHMPIRLDMYTIGSRYVVELKTQQEKLQINFRSYLGVRKNHQHERFCILLDAIWNSTIVRLINEMIHAVVDNGETITIDQCQITANGILCKGFFIEWSDLTYQKNYNRLTINSQSNKNIWTNLYYTQTDNVHILSSFLDWKYEV